MQRGIKFGKSLRGQNRVANSRENKNMMIFGKN
jgi:hypothetical protein